MGRKCKAVVASGAQKVTVINKVCFKECMAEDVDDLEIEMEYFKEESSFCG